MSRLGTAIAVASAAAAVPFAAVPAAMAGGGPLIGRHTGRRLARHELAEMTIWQRIWHWLTDLPVNAGHVVPGGLFGLIALAILAVLAVTLVLYWARPGRTGRVSGDAVLDAESMSARDYRRAAERLAAAGDYGGAIVDGVRAIAAELDERAILPPRPGRTANELGAEAGRALPGLATDLRAVARLFDDVRYGDKEGSQAGYDLVGRVDKAVRAARPAAGQAQEPAVAGLAVPR